MQSVIRKVIENTLWLLFQKVGVRIVTFILMIYLARSLGSSNFGKFTFATSFTLLFIALSDMGITTITIREVSRFKEKGPDYVGRCATLKIVLSIMAFIALTFSLAAVNVPTDTSLVVYLISACFLFRNVGVFFGAVFQAYEEMKYVSLTEFSQQVLLLLICLVLINFDRNLVSISLAYLFCAALYCFSNITIVHLKFFNPRYVIDSKFWLEVLKESYPLAIVAVISMVYFNIDIVMIGKIKGETDAGWYGICYNIFFVIATLPGAFLASIFPGISKYFIESESLLNNAYQFSFKLIIGVGIPLSIGLFLLSDNIIIAFFGNQYSPSITILKIFASLIILSYLNSLAGYFLTAVNKQKETAKTLAAITGVNIGLNAILIPYFSYIGAACATVISELLLFIFLTASLRGSYLRFSISDTVKPASASALMGFFIILMINRDWHLSVTVITAIVIYLSIIWITGYAKELKLAEL